MKLRALILFGIVFFSTCVVAQISADSLLKLSTSGTEREKWNANLQLSETYKYNDPQKALEFASAALVAAENLNDEAAIAKSNQVYAGILFRLGNFNKSKEYYQIALTKYSAAQNEKGKAEVQNALAGIYYAQGNIALAVQHYLDVLRYYEVKGDKAGLVNVYTSLANLYARQNNFSKSIEYNLKAIELYEGLSNKFQAIVIYDQIGNAYLKQNNLVRATEFFNKSLKAYTDLNNKAGIAYTLNQLGNIAAEEKAFSKAEKYFKRSNEMAEAMKTKYLQVVNLNALAGIYLLQKRYQESITCYKRAIAIAKPANMKLELEESYKGLSNVYELTKEQKKASTFSTLSTEIKDSLFNDSTLKQLSDLQLRYESEKKQLQIERLSKEQQLKENELLNERELKRFFIIVSVVFGIIFIILIYSFIQNKKYANSLQKQKNELEQKTFEILLQKEKLDQLNSVKDRFFSIISHDLRNNLTTMKLYFDLISNPDYKASDHSEISKQIAGSVENTIDLLENLLVWASAQIKGIPIHIQKLDLHLLAEENINLLSGTASQKRITIHNNLSENVAGYGDMDMINLVLRNLISNAIKFTPIDGAIHLSGEIKDKEIIVCVKDNGIGISEDNQQKMFDSHHHPTTKGTGNEKGTGLGLLLCKDFINQNKGRIWVESSKDGGSAFYFSLPA